MKFAKMAVLLVAAAALAVLATARDDSSPDPVKAAPRKPATVAAAAPAPTPSTSDFVVKTSATPGTPPSLVPAAPPATPTGPPTKAEIPVTTFDAGSVERGSDIAHSFVIKNVGEHDLYVDAKPG